MEQLSGKVVVVTGAASGIGLALAKKFGAEGMKVVMADIEVPALEIAAASLPDSVERITVVCDVSKGEQIDALRASAIDAFGAVHIVCNNAGVGGGGAMSDMNIDDWKWVIDVDLWSVIHGVRVFLPGLLEQGEGHIVNTASVAGLFSAPFMGPYNVAKYGVVALSETLCNELAMQQSEVGVSVLCPSWVKTKIASSVRNKPGATAEEADALAEFVQPMIDGGIDPDTVADRVIEAVNAKQFWIITHDDTPGAVTLRTRSILDGTNPPQLMH
jgi:NAD(P)-dependent dehydrogenase (short-subunit alcohol dehydrogenase family)